MEKQFLTVKDLMEMGLSQRKAYALMNMADAPIVRIGKSKYMLASKFHEWLEKKIEGGE